MLPPPPNWDPACHATGMPRIDEQHQMLFRMTHDFRAALDDDAGRRVYRDLLRSLRLYTDAHFGFEEDLMARCRCPMAEQNRAAHQVLAEVLAGYQRRYDDTGYSLADARSLIDELDRWLSEHICGIDMDLRGRVVPE